MKLRIVSLVAALAVFSICAVFGPKALEISRAARTSDLASDSAKAIPAVAERDQQAMTSADLRTAVAALRYLLESEPDLPVYRMNPLTNRLNPLTNGMVVSNAPAGRLFESNSTPS